MKLGCLYSSIITNGRFWLAKIHLLALCEGSLTALVSRSPWHLRCDLLHAAGHHIAGQAEEPGGQDGLKQFYHYVESFEDF